jgi:hypothetical protein
MTNWGVTTVFGMVGHSNFGLADALRLQEKKGRLPLCSINSRSLSKVDFQQTAQTYPRTKRLIPASRLLLTRPEQRNIVLALVAPLFIIMGDVFMACALAPSAAPCLSVLPSWGWASKRSQTPDKD